MKPLEHGKVIKEIFDNRIISLTRELEFYEDQKNISKNERDKIEYDIAIMENQLCLEYIKDRLDTLNKVLEINEKIENGNLSFVEKMEQMVELISIVNES